MRGRFIRTKIIGEIENPYMFLHGSDDVHVTIQLPHSEEIRFPFDFKDLWWEL